MRILIVSQYFWPENFRINETAFDLNGKGHEVTVFTGKPNYPKGKIYSNYKVFSIDKEIYKGITIYRVPLIPRGKANGIRLIINYISFAILSSLLAPIIFFKKSFDIILVFQLSPVTVAIPAIILKKIKKIPMVLWVLDIWPESLTSSGKVKSKFIIKKVGKLVRYIYKKSDKILISSRGFSKSIKQLIKIAEPIYFPNFIEESLTSNIKENIKIELPEGFIVMFAGNIGYSQAFPTIIEAAAGLKEFKEIHFVILGEGRMYSWVKQKIIENKLNDNFHLLGYFSPEMMPYFYNKADVLLVSLKKEPNFELTAPGKIQSYLASGKPVIASLDGEGSEIIAEAKAGFTCPAENADALRDSIINLYNLDPTEREQMGKNGKEYNKINFDKDLLLKNLERILEDAIQKNGK